MNTWPNRGASGGPCGGWKRDNPKTQTANLTLRPTGSDSSQQASSKPGAIQYAMCAGVAMGTPLRLATFILDRARGFALSVVKRRTVVFIAAAPTRDNVRP